MSNTEFLYANRTKRLLDLWSTINLIAINLQIPEIRDTVNEQIKIDLRESIISTILQAVGIAIGVIFMFCMSTYGKGAAP